ncbi:CapA family protein, partial [Arthrobacter sp. 2YAF22_2]|uniref:CapA family protein n=1 Tax=Arthrobacter sp. 2YAF22_2 TaxID=3233029 RepID=UPI003F908D87
MRILSSTPPGRLLAGAAAVILAVSLASCGLVARPDAGAPGSTPAADGPGSSAAGEPGTSPDPGPAATPTPTPTPTPGKGPACAAVRCTSVLVTGDMLVHAQLWEQARVDALATGAKGLDFGPLLAGQRRYIEKSDLAICHQETPVAGPTGPFSAYPSFNVPPQ